MQLKKYTVKVMEGPTGLWQISLWSESGVGILDNQLTESSCWYGLDRLRMEMEELIKQHMELS